MPSLGFTRRARSALFSVLRAMFRAMPLRESTRDVLRSRFLRAFPAVRPLPMSGQNLSTHEHRARFHSAGRGIGYVEHVVKPLPTPLPARLVAFYLPQFHTIPENDDWWGKGFTEWRNVTRALPQFQGHHQPRLPGDLGFYDLRSPQVMREQADLARAYGISAFCFYFYWFGGRTLLEEPLKQWLNDDSIDLQFCLCWANEDWTRRWDGRDGETLIAQTHSHEDDLAFIARVAPYLRDPRYVRVRGRPLLLLYRPDLLPDSVATTERWRTWCREHGVGEIELAYVQSFERPDPMTIGFDAAVEFPPNLATAPDLTQDQTLLNNGFSGQVLDWRALPDAYLRRHPNYRCYPGVNCGWDNEPRRPGKGRVFAHASPRRYRDWLAATIQQRVPAEPTDERLVFINAWNEWAEGAVLEPDAHLGHAWLDATRQAVSIAASHSNPHASRPPPCAIVHAWYPDVLAEILGALEAADAPWRLIITTSPCNEAAVRAVLQQRGWVAEVEVVENRGRDVLPFLRVANRLLDSGQDVVLKLHTKKSPHHPEGEKWCRELVGKLLADAPTEILARFAADPDLGLVAPAGHLLPLDAFWGGNEAAVRYLVKRCGIAPSRLEHATFPSGSMFWIRLTALRPLLDAHLQEWEFDQEREQLDGTIAHAIERAIGICVEASGQYSTSAGAEEDARDGEAYRYASH